MRRILPWLAVAPGILVLLLALCGPLLHGTDPTRVVALPYAGRGAGLPLGADYAGRDVWARVLDGGRSLVVVPVLGCVLTMLLGTAFGLVAGYLQGPVDAVVSRLDTLLLAVPPVLVVLILLHGWGYSAVTLVVGIVHTGYVDQAVALGDGPVAVMVREILPNVVRPILADTGSRLAIAIFLAASAGFLGFGPDQPNWGAMISENLEGITLSPLGVVVPAALLACLTITANLALDRLTARIP